MLRLTCVLEILYLKLLDQFQIQFLRFLRLNELNEHKFKGNFQKCLNQLCTCSLEIEWTIHFFWQCHFCLQIPTNLL